MKLTLYMATAINGVVARLNDETDFVSSAEWRLFRDAAERAGWIIVGRKTYELMLKADDLANLGSCGVVVVTAQRSYDVASPSHVVADSPTAAVTLLEQRGATAALVAGGGTLNAAFMEAGLIDEVQLDVEPIALGLGLPIFNGTGFEAKLELLEVGRFGTSGVRLRYGVIKR